MTDIISAKKLPNSWNCFQLFIFKMLSPEPNSLLKFSPSWLKWHFYDEGRVCVHVFFFLSLESGEKY